MKVYHLRYNPFTGKYILVSGRDFFKGERLEQKLDSGSDLEKWLLRQIDLKRSSEIHVRDLPEESYKRLEPIFYNSKVRIVTK